MPDAEIKQYPPEQQTLSAIIQDKAESDPDHVYVLEHGASFTYGQVNDLANRAAHGLLRQGVGKGEHVGLFLDNCAEFLACWFGIGKAGGVTVPFNTQLLGDMLISIVNHSDVVGLIIHEHYLERVLAVRQQLTNLRFIIPLPRRGESSAAPAGAMPFDEFASGPASPPDVEVLPTDYCTLLYTSGTTGRSKAARSVHGRYYAGGIGGAVAIMGYTKADCLYLCLPLFHAGGQFGCSIPALLSGARLALAPRFSASRFWDDVRSFGATSFLYIGTILSILHKQEPRPDDADNPVRAIYGYNAPRTIWREFEERFALRIMETYNQSEGCALRNLDGKLGSIGKPPPYQHVTILDDNDVEAPPGVVGEICARPLRPNVIMEGYYKDPEETLRVFRNLWLHSGDYGYRDEEGYFYYVDRKKDSIRRRGENISSADVEAIVNHHPQVLESAAIGVASEVHEDDVKICVVLKQGETLKPADLLAFCEERMAFFMLPRYIEFVQELPKTSTERVQKFKLREAGVTPATWDREAAGYQMKR